MALRVGLVGGTGFYEVPGAEAIEVETRHGDVTLHRTRVGGRETFFIPRHGARHTLAPHAVPYEAHVDALRAARCDYILTINNVGALRPELVKHRWVVIRDFIDLHRQRPRTIHGDRAVHTDFREPYCPSIRTALGAAVARGAPEVVYVGTDGPRFETPAEAQLMLAVGGDVVGMTGVQEAILAHERGLCYGTLGFVANQAAAGASSTAQGLQAALRRRRSEALSIVERAVRRLPTRKRCHCADAARGAELTLSGA